MKKYLLKSLALVMMLCASLTMGAVDWASIAWVGDGAQDGALSNTYKIFLPQGVDVVNIQKPGWAAEDGFYITFPDAALGECRINNQTAKYAPNGGGICLYISNFTAEETEVQVMNTDNSAIRYTLYVYYNHSESSAAEPTAAPDAPTYDASKVKAIYSPTYSVDCGHGAWGGSVSFDKQKTGIKVVLNNGGFVGFVDFPKLNCATMEKFHADVWVENNASMRFVPIITGQNEYGVTKSLNGGQWNSIEIALNEGDWAKTTDWSNVFQLKIDNASNLTFWINNIYFYTTLDEDTEKPVMTSATLESVSYTSAIIAVEATDNRGVTRYLVKNGETEIGRFVPNAGKITVTGLTAGTTVTLAVYALDGAGNISDNHANVDVTTKTYPAVAPVPDVSNKEYRAIYSHKLDLAVAHDFSLNTWGGTPYEKVEKDGDGYVLYNTSSTQWTAWGEDSDGNNAIVGKDGCKGTAHNGVDVSAMEYLHIDIWTDAPCTSSYVTINDTKLSNLNLTGTGWQSIDLPLSDYPDNPVKDWGLDNVNWMKFVDFNGVEKVAIANVYFWISTSTTKTLATTVTPADAGVVSIKQDGKEVTEAEKGTEVVFSATENDGYVFSGWYNGTTLVSTDKDYTLVVEKNTTLEARFRKLGNIYCHTPLTSGDNTIYLTMKQKGDNYTVVIDCEKEMAGFTNAYIGGINGNAEIKLNDADIMEKNVTLSADKHRLTVQVTSTTPIKWNSPIYINMPTKVTFAQPHNQNIEYSMPCADVKVESVSMPQTAEVIKGKTMTLVPTVEPLFATDKALVWTSDNEKTATVAEGIVTGVAEGEAVITATSKADPTKYATCRITVTPTILPDWVELTHGDHIIQYLAIHYTGTGTYVLTIKGISSNVTGMGGAFWTINGAGQRIDTGKEQVDAATIRMQVESNTAPQMYTPFYVMMPGEINFGQFTINWIEKAAPETPVTGVTLSESTYEMSINETHQLAAKVLPAIATNKTISWSSDNETVAGVDENGLVTAKAAGVAHITVTTADGGFTATCTITVVAAIEPMTFWGRGSNNEVDIVYSITRNTDRTLTYMVYAKAEKDVSVQVNDGDWRGTTKDNENYTYTSATTYADGETVKGFFYMVFAGGSARVDFTYMVGTENAPIIYTATDASTLKEHTDVILAEGAILTISTDKALGDIQVENGAVLNAEAALTADNLYLSSLMGGGKSAQVRGADKVTVQGDVYLDITLGDNANPDKWHAFTVPFPVDALNGIYDTDNNRLTNEVNYAIMDYHGDVRATGKYGWKKYRGMLQPGAFYIMTVDGNRTTFRFKKAAGTALDNAGAMAVHQYAASGEGVNGKDNGWNGIGNPTLVYGKMGMDVQVLNPATYTYELKEANTTNFTVGTPFFYQAAADGTETLLAADAGLPNYAPARESLSDKVYAGLSDDGYEDGVVLSASEDATTGYETGKDLVKLTMTDRPAVPQIFAQGYGLNLCKMDAPLANNTATYPVMLYAPAAGEYTLSARSGAEATVYLTKEGVVVWNLSDADYMVELNKGNNEGYGIVVVVNAPMTPTGMDGIHNEANAEKVLFHGNLYILRGGHTYDATGKMIQ